MGANQKLRKRTVWLLIIILAVGFGAVITRLAFLQLVQGEELQRRAIEQQLSDTPVSAKRGTIYDTKGKILAQSASVWQVVMAPAYFDDGADGDEQRHFVAKRLSEILGVDENETYEETKQNTYYVSVKRKVESFEKSRSSSCKTSFPKSIKRRVSSRCSTTISAIIPTATSLPR